jgi:hypothetical protein
LSLRDKGEGRRGTGSRGEDYISATWAMAIADARQQLPSVALGSITSCLFRSAPLPNVALFCIFVEEFHASLNLKNMYLFMYFCARDYHVLAFGVALGFGIG